MKKLDFRSFVIGFLMAIIFFLITGQSTIKSAVYDTLTVNNLKITGMAGVVNPDGELSIGLSSDANGGIIGIYDSQNKLQTALSSSVHGGEIYLLNKSSKVIASIRSNKENEGTIILLNKQGSPGWVATGKK